MGNQFFASALFNRCQALFNRCQACFMARKGANCGALVALIMLIFIWIDL